MSQRVFVSVSLLMGVFSLCAFGQNNSPLRQVQTIPMPNVKGRIDHMAVDVRHRRLFLAALGNNSLEVLDLGTAKVSQTLTGLLEPQGLAYIPEMDRLFAADGGDGKCHVYSGEPLRSISAFDVGPDADNVRYDPAGRRVYIGYGSGAIAVIDPSSLMRVGDIKLEGHPESFRFEPAGSKIFANVPDARNVTVADRATQKVLTTWPFEKYRANFPMALIDGGRRIVVVTRRPPKLVVLDAVSGRTVAEADCAGDADDVFYDDPQKLVYVSCGEGVIDVFSERDSGQFREIVRIPTAAGARTSLWVPELNELFLAVPARDGHLAEVRVYRRE